ncbi:hypothetical protein PIB30_077774 [Stylosanthes scabra]|uniref:Uncharacterized protein n=1 Tax=Stylosanthes scabra TaxID=79078 RepID=A0ABU6YS16_9FABA|nr:hypothetical protein [Stylosanthes scabra]
MAGILTAIVYAGKRNLRKNNTNSKTCDRGGQFLSSSTATSFSLNHPNNLKSPLSHSSTERNVLKDASVDESDIPGGGAVREAKKKLDDKFRSSQQRKLEKPKRKCIYRRLWGMPLCHKSSVD